MKFCYFTALAILCITFNNGLCTETRVDSLIEEVRRLEDEENPQSYKKAKKLAEDALIVESKIKGGYKKGKGNCHLEIGLCLYHLGHYEEALEEYSKALSIRMELGEKTPIASVYNNMSSAYLALYRIDDALRCSLKSIEYYKEDGNDCALIMAYNNYANALEEKPSQIDTAIACNRKAIKMIKLYPCEVSIKKRIDAEYGLAKRLVRKGELVEAQAHFDTIININKKNYLKNTSAVAMAYLGLGHIALKQEKLDSAGGYFEKAKNEFLSLDNAMWLATVYQYLGDLNQMQKEFGAAQENYEAALDYLDKMPKLEEEGDTRRKIIEMGLQLNSKNEKEYIQDRVYAGGIILVLLVFFGLWHRKNNKEKKMIQETADLEKKVLQETAKVAELGRDLSNLRHNGIKGTLGTLLILLEAEIVDVFMMRSIIQDAIEEYGNTNLGDVELGKLVKHLRTKASCYAQKEVELIPEINGAEAYKVKEDVHKKLRSIVNLAFANVQRHAQCTIAALYFEVLGDNLLMEIKDNGKGFDRSKIRKGALGLNNIEAEARAINATCTINSTLGSGTSIRLFVPSPFVFEG